MNEEETKLCFLNELVKQEFFIEITKNYILDFIRKTNPTFNITKKYSYEELICLKSILEENNIKAINYEAENYPLNEYLANIVFERLTKGLDDFNWAKVKPLYIQPPSIFGK